MKQLKDTGKWYHLAIPIGLIVIILGVFLGYYGYGYPTQSSFVKEAKPTASKTTVQPILSHNELDDAIDQYEPLQKSLAMDSKDLPVIPGIQNTQTINSHSKKVEICTSMTPQGVATYGDYLFTSSYDHDLIHNSVIYVQSLKTGKLINTIVLQGQPHVGGIAFDPKNEQLWVCGTKDSGPELFSIKLNRLLNYKISDGPISYNQRTALGTVHRASFVNYTDNSLFVGFFNPGGEGQVSRLDLNNAGEIIGGNTNLLGADNSVDLFARVLQQQQTIQKAQGLTFSGDYALLSQSYGANTSFLYIFKKNLNQKVFRQQDALKIIPMPSHLEQISSDGNKIYMTFESSNRTYRKTSKQVVDRVVITTLDQLLKNAPRRI